MRTGKTHQQQGAVAQACETRETCVHAAWDLLWAGRVIGSG